MLRRSEAPDAERGQILVIVAAGLMVLIAFVGLVIDGGNAWSQQRAMQNATDAAAEAGAVVLAERIGGTTRTDGDVMSAIDKSRTDNTIQGIVLQVPGAYYTDYLGRLLKPDGSLATGEADAARVGAGTIPDGAFPTQGVKVYGRRTFPTFVARVIGFTQWTTAGEATAVAGPPTGVCAAADGCGLLPVTFPVNQIRCDGQGNLETINGASGPLPYQVGETYKFPLCKNVPGNLGWLDWVPPYGGTSELVASTLTPANPAVPLPSWQRVGETGAKASAALEDALNSWVGQEVKILMFDSTCGILPAGTELDACPEANVGGTGSSLSYHIPKVMTLVITAAYTNGQADEDDSGNSACAPVGKRCIIGTIKAFADSGTVGLVTGPAPLGDVNIQLIH